MICDTASPTTGGTTDLPEYDGPSDTVATVLYAAYGGIDRDFERTRRKAESHADLMRFLGARMKGLTVQWWPVVKVTTTPMPGPVMPRLGIWAGLREPTRGRHWDRRRR